MATWPELTVAEPYGAYAQVFLEADSGLMPSHGPQDLAIKLLNSKKLLCGFICNLSKKELDTFFPFPKF
jgi:hypothetical protein